MHEARRTHQKYASCVNIKTLNSIKAYHWFGKLDDLLIPKNPIIIFCDHSAIKCIQLLVIPMVIIHLFRPADVLILWKANIQGNRRYQILFNRSGKHTKFYERLQASKMVQAILAIISSEILLILYNRKQLEILQLIHEEQNHKS